MVRRSRTSGSFLRMASWRASTTRLSQASGPTTPAKAMKTNDGQQVDARTGSCTVHTTNHSTGTATTRQHVEDEEAVDLLGLTATGDDQLVPGACRRIRSGRNRLGQRRR